MKLYKLTNQAGQTQNNTQWGKNVTHTADGKSNELCNFHWIHAYPDPLLAVLMNPAHADILNPKLWLCKGAAKLKKPDKIGCASLTTIKEIPLPKINQRQKVKFACLCVREVYDLWEKYDEDGIWLKWYNDGCPAAYDITVDADADVYAYIVSAVCAACTNAYANAAAANAAVAAANAAYAYATVNANAAVVTYTKKINLVKLAYKAMKNN